MEGTVGIYEIRVEIGSNIFRAFAFFDEGQLIVVANGFQKKTQKTPKNEIELANGADQMIQYVALLPQQPIVIVVQKKPALFQQDYLRMVTEAYSC